MSNVTLNLLASDVKTTKYLSNEDCVVARAANRVLKDEYKSFVGGWDFHIVRKTDGVILAKGIKIGKNGFDFDQMQAMIKSGKGRKIVVDIPKEYLKPKADNRDKYDKAIDYLCGIQNRQERKLEVYNAWGNPAAMGAPEKGGVLFSFLTTEPAAASLNRKFCPEGGGCLQVGCISQVANEGDSAPTESLKQYIKSVGIVEPHELKKLGVKKLRKELYKYRDIQRAMDICFRFKAPNVVNV